MLHLAPRGVEHPYPVAHVGGNDEVGASNNCVTGVVSDPGGEPSDRRARQGTFDPGVDRTRAEEYARPQTRAGQHVAGEVKGYVWRRYDEAAAGRRWRAVRKYVVARHADSTAGADGRGSHQG